MPARARIHELYVTPHSKGVRPQGSRSSVFTPTIYSVSQKKIPPYGFLKIFPKRLGICNQFFIHLLCDHFYTKLQIFIQLSPTLTTLCHTKRDHLANLYISLEL